MASDGAAGDWFGISVAVEGDTAVIGAYGDDDHGADSGSAYVFTRDPNGVWRETAKLTNPDGAEGDNFGISVAVDQNAAVTGAPGDDYNSRADTGSFYVTDIGDWTDIPGSDATTTSHTATDLTGQR